MSASDTVGVLDSDFEEEGWADMLPLALQVRQTLGGRW